MYGVLVAPINSCYKISVHFFLVPIVWQTWAPDAGESITYYSDIEDNEYSTIDIRVPNTERGRLFIVGEGSCHYWIP